MGRLIPLSDSSPEVGLPRLQRYILNPWDPSMPSPRTDPRPLVVVILLSGLGPVLRREPSDGSTEILLVAAIFTWCARLH